MSHEPDELRQRAEDGDPTAAEEAGMRELSEDELDEIGGGSASMYGHTDKLP